MADPVRPLLDGGASAVKDNRPGRKASGGTGRATGPRTVVPSALSRSLPTRMGPGVSLP